jgi:hemolysin III
MLISIAKDQLSTLAAVIYSISLIGLFGTSALYHRRMWGPSGRDRIRRLDHSAIFVLIAGTGTPVCLLSIAGDNAYRLLALFWGAAIAGVLQSMFWSKAPRWLGAIFYVSMGWLAVPFVPELSRSLGIVNVTFLILGGVIYTLGALVYATKIPNPSQKYFGYHEVFHLMVIAGAFLHFLVVRSLVI